MMDCRRKIFEMLQIKPNEVFKLEGQSWEYKIDECLCLMEKSPNSDWYMSCYDVVDILKGDLVIENKFKLTNNDKIILSYGLIAGFNWFVKDDLDKTVFFKEKPKKASQWYSSSGLLDDFIICPVNVSFITPEDFEPHYIRDYIREGI